jgi:hypothetical protein
VERDFENVVKEEFEDTKRATRSLNRRRKDKYNGNNEKEQKIRTLI